MSNKKEVKTIALTELKISNLPEVISAKTTQQKLVEDNPFVAIVDNKTYTDAKAARTALVKGRTAIQGQDKTIATTLANLRKESKEVMDNIIAISQPYEIKQQEEVTRYEDEKKAAKLEVERIAKERDDSLKLLISDFKVSYTNFIAASTLENIESLNVEITEAELNVFEFETLFQECKDDLFLLIANKNKTLEAAEVQRLAAIQLKADQEILRKEREEQQIKNAAAEKLRLENQAKENKRIADANKIIEEKAEKQRIADKELADERAAFQKEKDDLKAAQQKVINDEADRVRKIKEDKEAALKVIEDEKNAKKLAADNKKKADAEAKRIEALKPDIEKINNYLDSLSNFALPEMSTDLGSDVLMSAYADLDIAIKEIQKQVNDELI